MRRIGLIVFALLLLAGTALARPGRCSLEREQMTSDYSLEVTPAGGSFLISRKDSPFDGCELEIPKNALLASQTITFSHANGKFTDAQGNTHEVTVLSLSPFQTTRSGHGYADEIVFFRIPVDPAQPVLLLMACFFDEGKKFPDMVPMMPTADGQHLGLSTRHFNHPFFFLGMQ